MSILPAGGNPPSDASIHAAAEALAAGLIVGIPTDTVYGLAVDPTRAGSTDALFLMKGRPTGLEDLQAIVGEAPRWLTRPGALVAELAPHQAEAAVVLAFGAGFTEVEIRPDLTGRPRVLLARSEEAA